MTFHRRIIIRSSPGLLYPPEAADFTVRQISGCFCHILQLGVNQFRYSEIFTFEKKKDETDAAELFSSSLTLAASWRGMIVISRTIYTQEAFCFLLKHISDQTSSSNFFVRWRIGISLWHNRNQSISFEKRMKTHLQRFKFLNANGLVF